MRAGRARRVAWAASTGAVLVIIGVLVVTALAAPGWVSAVVVFTCMLVGAPLGARLEAWVDRH